MSAVARVVPVVLACSCLLHMHAQAQDTAIDFRPLWTSGQSATYEFFNRMDQTVNATLGDRSQSQTTSQEATGQVTWTVDRVNPDGSTSNTMTLDWMAVTATAGTPGSGKRSSTVAADSRKPSPGSDDPAQPMHDLISAMAGVPLTVELAPDGKVTRLTGTDAIKSRTENPDLVPSDLDFEETASDLAALVGAPTQPVAPGKTWKADFRWDHETGKMNYAWTYTFDRVEQAEGVDLAIVTGKARLKLEPETPKDRPAKAPPVSIRLLDGEAATTIYFDPARHEVVARHANASERIEVSVPFPDGRTFKRVIQETSTSQLLRVEEK